MGRINQQTPAKIHLEKARFLLCDASLRHKYTDFKASQLSSTCLKIAFPCKQKRACCKQSFCMRGFSQTTTCLESAKRQPASLLRRRELRSVKALVGTQPIDFRRWESKCTPQAGSPPSTCIPAAYPGHPALPPQGYSPKCLISNICSFWHASGEKKNSFGSHPG